MMGKVGNAALGIACASLVISIIAISVPYWFQTETNFPWGSSIVHYGLWITCNQSEIHGQKEPMECRTFETMEGHLSIDLIRAVELIGLLLEAIAMMLGLFNIVRKSAGVLCFAAGLSSLAGILMLLGAAVFGAKTRGVFEHGITLHFGFGFAILSGLLAMGASAMFMTHRTQITVSRYNVPF